MSDFSVVRMAAIAAIAAAYAQLAAPADAATLNPGTGTVSISRAGSTGFETVTSPTSVAPGDTVIVGDGGSAQISFENGAIETVSPGQIYSVPTVPPAVGPPGTPGVPGVPEVPGVPGAPGAPGVVGGLTTTTLAVGAGVGAAAIGVGVVASKQEKPRSP